jgi:hypothetical protein
MIYSTWYIITLFLHLILCSVHVNFSPVHKYYTIMTYSKMEVKLNVFRTQVPGGSGQHHMPTASPTVFIG